MYFQIEIQTPHSFFIKYIAFHTCNKNASQNVILYSSNYVFPWFKKRIKRYFCIFLKSKIDMAEFKCSLCKIETSTFEDVIFHAINTLANREICILKRNGDRKAYKRLTFPSCTLNCFNFHILKKTVLVEQMFLTRLLLAWF